ncbi:MAG TPA: hypothetical protein VHN80_25050 [Kineosporiaceae bacterium]|jgi:hypothetical protein|nr:hypothetical protein [Kineosporiaceae bacterium]
MTSDDKHNDLNRRYSPAPPDLAILSAHPSLNSLRGQGSLLDRLPTDGTALAFACAVTAGFAVYGRTGAAVVIIWTLLTLFIAALGLRAHDLRRARLTLEVARYGLLTMLVGVVALAATVSGLPPLDGHTPSTTSAPTVAVRPAPAGPNDPGTVPAGTLGSTPTSTVWSP